MGNVISIISSLANPTTIVGYSVIIVIAGFLYKFYSSKKASKLQAKGRDILANQPKKENKAKRQRTETFAKTQTKSPAAVPKAPETKTAPAPAKSKNEVDVDDRAFAQQMAINKQNKFATKTTSEQKHKQKSVKQSKAKEVNGASKAADVNKATEDNEVAKQSASSSIVGADDDSPITTPSTSAADATGVSDMLEQPSTGPSVLRLTNTEEKPKKIKKAKAPEPTETKKQRQNRQKREQEKAIREEQEKGRKVLEEAQRRTAREAEGRAAKDGSAFMAAQKVNAWKEEKANGVSQEEASAAHQPLDTFDAASQSTVKVTAPATTNGKVSNQTVKQNGTKTDWADVPYSEEEQIKMIEEQDDFTPVKTKKSKRAQKANNAGAASSDDGSVHDAIAPAAATTSAPSSKDVLTNGRPKPHTIPTQSSFAALIDDGADLEDDDEDDVQQEWTDV